MSTAMRAQEHKEEARRADDHDPMSPLSLDEALEPGKKDEMQGLLGEDLSSVTVENAQGLGGGAVAATEGERIRVDGGTIDLGTKEGKAILGHELAHVVQQREGKANGEQHKQLGDAHGDALEAEADHVGSRLAEGEPAGEIVGRASAEPQFFGAREHELMGNVGAKNAKVKLADDYELNFGEVVALAGDHFSSIEQMREFAKRTDGGAGSRLEIEYARKWKLGKQVTWVDGDPKYDAAEKAQKKRYYVLAGGNEPGYGGNASHFLNPMDGDTARSTADKAGDTVTRPDQRVLPPGRASEDEEELRDSGYGPAVQAGNKMATERMAGYKTWTQIKGGRGAPAQYRVNHEKAIAEAAIAGHEKQDVSGALAVDAFACHSLTDSFASGHVRTPRQGAKDYWDPKVPMFYENLVGYMGQELYRDLDDNWSIDGADFVTENYGWKAAKDEVRGVFEAKARLTFGDVVGLALHDFDNRTGVKAHVNGQATTLHGDGEVFSGNVIKDPMTLGWASTAVAASVAEVNEAYELGKCGETADAALQHTFAKAGGEMFEGEKFIPTVTPEDLKDPSNPMIDWKFPTWEALLSHDPFVAALKVFADEKAGELKEAGFTGNKQDALVRLGERLKSDPAAIMKKIINFVPNTGGGLLGDQDDDNARDYVKLAEDNNALYGLTNDQRYHLMLDCYNGYQSEADEETVWKILDTAPEPDARYVITWFGWNDIADMLDGVEDDKFRAKFPKSEYGR